MKQLYFRLHTSAFIAGTVSMTAQEVGAYIRLLCYQWEHGKVPEGALERIAGCPVSEAVRSKFPAGMNARLEIERETLNQGPVVEAPGHVPFYRYAASQGNGQLNIIKVEKFKVEAAKLFNSRRGADWGRELEERILALVLRGGFEAEWREIQGLKNTLKFFPESIPALLNRWDDVLERGKAVKRPESLLDKEIRRLGRE